MPETLITRRRPSSARMSGRLESMVRGQSLGERGAAEAGLAEAGEEGGQPLVAAAASKIVGGVPLRGDPAAVHEHDAAG